MNVTAHRPDAPITVTIELTEDEAVALANTLLNIPFERRPVKRLSGAIRDALRSQGAVERI